MAENEKFKVLASYCINIVYNDLYNKSVADKIEYAIIINQFIKAVRSDSILLKKFVRDMYRFYKRCSDQDSLTEKEFVEDICDEFTTKEMRKKIKTFDQVHEIVSVGFYELLSGVSTYITKPDNIKNTTVAENRHGDIAKKFTEAVLNHGIAVLIHYRTKIINSFIEKNTGIKNSGKSSDIVKLEVYEKLIRALAKQNNEFKEKLRKYKQRIRDLEYELDDLENRDDENNEPNGEPKGELEDQEKSSRDDRNDRSDRNSRSDRSDRPDRNDNKTKKIVDASFFESQVSETNSKNNKESLSQLQTPNFKLPRPINNETKQKSQETTTEIETTPTSTPQIETYVTDRQTSQSSHDVKEDSLSKLEKMVENFPVQD